MKLQENKSKINESLCTWEWKQERHEVLYY